MTWVLNNLELIGSRTLSHLLLAIPAIVASFVLALPLGLALALARLSRWRALHQRALAGDVPEDLRQDAGDGAFSSPTFACARNVQAKFFFVLFSVQFITLLLSKMSGGAGCQGMHASDFRQSGQVCRLLR